MKVTSAILLFFCLFGLALSYSERCFDTECVKAEEVCGYGNKANNASYIDCRADSQCTSPSTARGETGICRVPAKLGDYCGDYRTCESGTTCDNRYSDRLCVLVSPITFARFNPGESCDYNIQCNYNSPYSSLTGDNDNLCNNGKCKHVKTGDYCNGDNQCDYTKAYCGRTNTCEKYIGEGGACFLNDQSGGGCGRDRDCVPNGQEGNAGTCRKYYSQKEGQFCGDDDHCQDGLTCNENTGADNADHGVCFKPYETATLNKPCPNITDTVTRGCNVTNLEECTCTPQDEVNICLVTVNPKGRKAGRDLSECLRRHYCNSNDFSCIKKHCKSERCKSYKESRKNPTTPKSCTWEGLCNSGFTLVASPVLAIFAFVVVLAL